MTARVVFTPGFSRLGERLEKETTVAIDGQIHETAYFQPIREGFKVFFIPSSKGDSGRIFRTLSS